ncbi:MAG: hypothetical protein H8E55_01940 [Pelagibacterales bacterium]|nr:hypothetical protein [Pelagibacterales bacterium]
MSQCGECGVELIDKNWSFAKQAFDIKTCKKCNNISAQLNKTNTNNCIYCNYLLIIGNNWSESSKKSRRFYCKFCENKITRYRLNKKRRALGIPKQKVFNTKQRLLSRQMRSKLNSLNERYKCIKAYGNECNCCKNNVWQFLSIDHIYNDGASERAQFKIRGTTFYKYLRKLGYPTVNYQLLCTNCNSAKGYHGFCPHQLNTLNDCSFCGVALTDYNCFEFNIEFNHSICADCVLMFSRRNSNSVSRYRYKSKRTHLNLKMEVIKNYGGKCSCCGEIEPYFLGIDHIYNNGAQDRKKGLRGALFYRWLAQHNFPSDDYQLLCFNCNSCKGTYGQCHHQLKDKHSLYEYQLIIRDIYENRINNAAL